MSWAHGTKLTEKHAREETDLGRLVLLSHTTMMLITRI